VDSTYTSHFNALLSRGPDSRTKLAEVAVVLEECGLIGTLDIGITPHDSLYLFVVVVCFALFFFK
jgi:hypothetical protein